MRRAPRPLLSEINIIPLVDIILVLLIIFMVTAPLLSRGVDVALPRAVGRQMTLEPSAVVTVARDGAVYLDRARMTLPELGQRLRGRAGGSGELAVYLRADRTVSYGTVMAVMDEVRQAGVSRLGMVTEPAGPTQGRRSGTGARSSR